MKSKYIAHVVMYIEIKEGPQDHYPVFYNLVYIECAEGEDPYLKAEGIGCAAEGDDGGSFTWGGRPAKWGFSGVRTVQKVEGVADGQELAYVEMSLPSLPMIRQLAAGTDGEVGLVAIHQGGGLM